MSFFPGSEVSEAVTPRRSLYLVCGSAGIILPMWMTLIPALKNLSALEILAIGKVIPHWCIWPPFNGCNLCSFHSSTHRTYQDSACRVFRNHSLRPFYTPVRRVTLWMFCPLDRNDFLIPPNSVMPCLHPFQYNYALQLFSDCPCGRNTWQSGCVLNILPSSSAFCTIAMTWDNRFPP